MELVGEAVQLTRPMKSVGLWEVTLKYNLCAESGSKLPMGSAVLKESVRYISKPTLNSVSPTTLL
jgi:hypothetical protein